MSVYYNEFDPKAAAWLRELIASGLIPAGDVDERSIVNVEASDLKGYTQCHFFAGIGGWSYALRLAGWPDDAPVWTGSCPCQPFSVAGKGKGESDERHLWPEFRRLIEECEPPVVFGEQVASKAGRSWLAGVRAEVEALGYGFGAADLCAASVNAPHIRQRLFWVADSATERPQQERNVQAQERPTVERSEQAGELSSRAARRSEDGGLADANGRNASAEGLQRGWKHGQQPEDDGPGSRLADAVSARLCGGGVRGSGANRQQVAQQEDRSHSANESRNGCEDAVCGLGDSDEQGPQGRRIDSGEHADQRSPWASSVLIPCADGKARRVEPSIQPLAHGISGRVGLLRGAGNAIVPQVAQAFIEAYMSIEKGD